MRIDFNQGIIYGESCKAGHQVFNGGHNEPLDTDNGCKAGIYNPVEPGRYAGGVLQIRPDKFDAMIDWRRLYLQVDFPAWVDAHAGTAYGSGYGSLAAIHATPFFC